MSHGLLPEKQQAQKSIQEEPGRNAQKSKISVLQAERIEKRCFQVHLWTPAIILKSYSSNYLQ